MPPESLPYLRCNDAESGIVTRALAAIEHQARYRTCRQPVQVAFASGARIAVAR